MTRKESKKNISQLDMFCLSFGAMIGWGWVLLSGRWVEQAGIWGACAAFVVGGLMCATVGLVYAELTSAMPYAGGPVVFALEGLGYPWAWMAGWSMCFAYASVAAWESIAIVNALDFLVTIPQFGVAWTVFGAEVHLSKVVFSIALTWVIAYINYRGVAFSVKAQTKATLGLITAGVLLFTGAALFGTGANMTPATTDFAGFCSVVIMVPFLMVGFDVIPQSAEEAKFPRKALGVLLIASVLGAVLWYILVVLSVGAGLPPSGRGETALPAATALQLLTGSTLAGRIMTIGGILGIATSWNAFFLGASRILFAMGKQGMLPSKFRHLDQKTGAPTTAIIVLACICSLAPLVGENAITWLVNTGSFATLVVYGIVVLAYLRLEKRTEMQRPFRLRQPRLIGSIALVVTGLLLILYTPVGPYPLTGPEWFMISLWSALGFLLYRKSRRQQVGD